jgi:predicted ArsR family transcriptional regulator
MNKLQNNILNCLKERPMTIYELMSKLRKAKTTIHDNTIVLKKIGKLEIFSFNNQCKGRPINFYRLLNNKEISGLEISKILKEIDIKKKKINHEFVMSIDYNSQNIELRKEYTSILKLNIKEISKQLIQQIKKSQMNMKYDKFKQYKKKEKIIKEKINLIQKKKDKIFNIKVKEKRIIIIDICNSCKREISQTIPLIKLTDNNYYCHNCINRYPKIFNLINPNGLLYKSLKSEV